MSVNKVILIGHVGKDPEIHSFDNGTKKASFSLATSETYKTKDGEQKTETQWHTVVCFRSLADLVEKWITKGKQLYVEGKVTYRTYEDKDGNRRGTTEILAENIRFIGGKSEPKNPRAEAESILAEADNQEIPL